VDSAAVSSARNRVEMRMDLGSEMRRDNSRSVLTHRAPRCVREQNPRPELSAWSRPHGRGRPARRRARRMRCARYPRCASRAARGIAPRIPGRGGRAIRSCSSVRTHPCPLPPAFAAARSPCPRTRCGRATAGVRRADFQMPQRRARGDRLPAGTAARERRVLDDAARHARDAAVAMLVVRRPRTQPLAMAACRCTSQPTPRRGTGAALTLPARSVPDLTA
jgi:hypothetical protein